MKEGWLYLMAYSLQNEKKESAIISYIIFVTIICLPILDILTSITRDWALSVGQIIRMLGIGVVYIWLSVKLYQKKTSLFWWMQLTLFIFIFSFLIHWRVQPTFSFFAEGIFLAKTIFGVIILFAVLYLIQWGNLHLLKLFKASSITAIIIGVSFWIAVISGTGFSSYTYEKAGYSGWFYAANELSVIIVILLALVLVYHHIQRNTLSVTALLFLFSVIPMIGTKTALYGGLFLIIMNGVIIAFQAFKKRQFSQYWKKHTVTGLLLIVYICSIPLTPAYQNMSGNYHDGNKKLVQEAAFQQQLLSSRDVYVKTAMTSFKKASLLERLFGMGYGSASATELKMVEMDGYDLLFSYGIVGLVDYLMLCVLLARQIIRFWIDRWYFLLMTCLVICVGISLVAGHVVFAPAVMGYVGMLLIVIGGHISNHWTFYSRNGVGLYLKFRKQ